MKQTKVYKVKCIATGKICPVRPDVWEARIRKFNTDSKTLQDNYISRESLKLIKESQNPVEQLKTLQYNNKQLINDIDPQIWSIYLRIDDDIKDIIQTPTEQTTEHITETIETIEYEPRIPY